ncbi:MAG: transposase, partial [Burkholderiaceae bacterium]|nr:transposase [Burkholderiaceae bacterium]
MRKKYSSDITREQFEQIAPLLEGLRKKTRPPTVDLYEVFCAVLYLLKSGCQYRHFCQLDATQTRLPDESTILKFRHLLERHALADSIFAHVSA